MLEPTLEARDLQAVLDEACQGRDPRVTAPSEMVAILRSYAQEHGCVFDQAADLMAQVIAENEALSAKLAGLAECWEGKHADQVREEGGDSYRLKCSRCGALLGGGFISPEAAKAAWDKEHARREAHANREDACEDCNGTGECHYCDGGGDCETCGGEG